MTPEKAIEAIKIEKISIEGKAERVAEFFEGLSVAKSAIEKQILKKVNNFSEDSDISACVPKTKSGNCPICNAFIWGERAYCEKCGQALDWSDTE